MLFLLITVILAGLFALFATQNTTVVEVSFGKFVLDNIPLYLVVLVPLLIGLLASYFIYIMYFLSTKLTLSEQKDKINYLKEENSELTKDLHKLELENAKLKSQNGEPIDEESI